MSNTPDVTTLALLNLIRLLSAELVAGQHRDDVAKLIEAMERQLNATPLPRGIDVNDARTGIARAKQLLRPYVAHVRQQAEAVHLRDQTETTEAAGDRLPTLPTSKYLQ
jgi:hypothetical protein